jgi:hypothetical protein
MTFGVWRLRAAAGIAVAAVGALLALPAPRQPDVATPAGPLTLGQAWPGIRTVDFPGVTTDGDRFFPMLVLDAHTVAGTLTSSDFTRSSFVILPVAPAGDPRTLQTSDGADAVTVNAVAAADGQLYWMSGEQTADGRQRSGLYRVDPVGGSPHLITSDTGDAIYGASQFDLQIVDGRAYWVATRTTQPLTSELRSVPVDGGPVAVVPLDGPYALVAWPWLTSYVTPLGQQLTQFNAVTGAHRTIVSKPGEQLSCGAIWCRGIVSRSTAGLITLRRPDGSDEVRVNVDGEGSMTIDVAIADRFEFVAAPISTQQVTSSEKLTMYDVKDRRRIALAVATAEGVHGSWVWWATGDNETLTWRALDLAALS